MSTLKTNRTKLAMLVGLVAVVGVVGYLASTKDTPTSTEAAGTVMPAERFAAGELQPSVSLDQGGVGVSPEAVSTDAGDWSASTAVPLSEAAQERQPEQAALQEIDESLNMQNKDR